MHEDGAALFKLITQYTVVSSLQLSNLSLQQILEFNPTESSVGGSQYAAIAAPDVVTYNSVLNAWANFVVFVASETLGNGCKPSVTVGIRWKPWEILKALNNFEKKMSIKSANT